METKIDLRKVAYEAGRESFAPKDPLWRSWSEILGLEKGSFARLTEKAQEGIIDAYFRGALDAVEGAES